MAVNTDITDRVLAARERQQLLDSERSARAEAERANRLKDEFVATLSHELRTPLHAILGWTQILKNKADDPRTVERGLEVIERNARAQSQMISDLLDMSRIVSGKMRLEVAPVDLAAVIEGAVESVRLAADAKGLHLVEAIDRSTGVLTGDPDRLRQVVWNLLSNAIKFTPAGGTVRIDLAPSAPAAPDGGVEIRVSDSGQGFAPAFLPISSTVSARRTPRSPGARAGSASGCRSSSSSSSSTAAPSAPRAPAPAWAPPSR